MSFLVQHGKVRGQTISVPDGLPEILSDIAREVLRCQPTTDCLCHFIVDYLQSVIMAREKAKIARSVINHSLQKVDEIISDMCLCDITKAKSDEMCLAMEECFKSFLAKRRCEMGKHLEIVKYNDCDMLDHLIKQCNFSEAELKVARPLIEASYQKFVDVYLTTREKSEGTEALYQYFQQREMNRLEEKKQQEAAIKIQAYVRGYLIRNSHLMSRPPVIREVPPPMLQEYLEAREQAAHKIQRFYRSKSIQRQEKTLRQRKYECEPESNVSLAPLAVTEEKTAANK